MIEIQDLYWLTLGGIILIWWWQSIKMREQALWQAKKYCEQMNLQWLDQNLVMKKIRFIRKSMVYWKIEITFQFEFATTGSDRYRGFLIFVGGKLSQIVTDPYEPQEDLPEATGRPFGTCKR